MKRFTVGNMRKIDILLLADLKCCLRFKIITHLIQLDQQATVASGGNGSSKSSKHFPHAGYETISVGVCVDYRLADLIQGMCQTGHKIAQRRGVYFKNRNSRLQKRPSQIDIERFLTFVDAGKRSWRQCWNDMLRFFVQNLRRRRTILTLQRQVSRYKKPKYGKIRKYYVQFVETNSVKNRSAFKIAKRFDDSLCLFETKWRKMCVDWWRLSILIMTLQDEQRKTSPSAIRKLSL
uniref:Uncharacterized protein n=1 Tax=Romanomermis culicivorax TaxID=13658 RepID=A0A915I6Z5_ROMCU